MPTLKQISMQETNELRFNRKHIDTYIREEFDTNPEIQAFIDAGEEIVTRFVHFKFSYASKNERLTKVQEMDIRELVKDILVGVAYFREPELLSSVVPQLAGRLGFSDRREAATTIAELLAVIGHAYAYEIVKMGNAGSLHIQSKLPLSNKLLEYIDNSRYLPPMVCKPLKLKSNYDSGYLTHRDSLILGTGNHHEEDICLDVLNLMNAIPLQLCTEFLSTVEEEEPNWEEVTQDKIDNWKVFKEQSYYFYTLLVQQGNELYFTNKVDKRGRIYTQGYHLNVQGTSFKKAMLELKKEEYVDGIPAHLMTN